MAGNYDSKPCRFRPQIQLSKIVQYKNGNTGEFDHFRLRQLPRPRCCVDVPADGDHGRDSREFLKNFGRTNVSGVNDVV
jgi:hypothetical protein